MSKLIIYLPGKARVQGYKMYDFLWDESLQCFVFRGKAYDPHEFNEAYDICMKRFRRLLPTISVKVIGLETAPVVAATPAPTPTPAPHEITVEEAEAVMQRLAPDRLKKKPGPKPPETVD